MENKISIIMGIYNCADTLSEAIDSIIAQTYTNWELIMCDDGSVDDTVEVAKEYVKMYPGKIHLMINRENKGLNFTLNKCLKKATGTFIGRMDGDDYCTIDRFEKEMFAFEQEPDLAIVSCDMGFFDEQGIWGNIQNPDYPNESDLIKQSPFCHAGCLVRKEAFDEVGGYSVDNKLLRVEDYHLWVKMYEFGYRGKNIHETLYYMRDDRTAYSRRKFRYRCNESYVKLLAVCKFRQYNPLNIVRILRPIIVGLLPGKVYDILHKGRLKV